MSTEPRFLAAYPYQKDVLALPVTDIDAAASWYSQRFGMHEVERHQAPVPRVVLERDDARLGFAITGGDASQDGAAILVSGLHELKAELEGAGVQVANLRVDERDSKKFKVFFAVAPDGLCYYFHEPI
jgi:catechol 2,3-dioxygenase-like lactoylglutathione lyase family enzyme